MPLLAATTFLSALLLFQVQPMAGRVLLPWFGGSPEVWTTCVLFFQAVLLGGYGFAHGLMRLGPRAQAWAHAALLGAAAAALAATTSAWGSPLGPSAAWRPAGDAGALQVLGLLTAMVGLPYLALSTTGPLLQAWAARLFPGRPVYRLYALSNAGSLLGLLAYPFAVEPALSLREQGRLWALGFAAFAALGAAVGSRAARAPLAPAQVEEAAGPGPTWGQVGGWVALAAVPSMLLLSLTSELTQDVAPVPFLWVVPLALYLTSFIVAFESDRWATRGRVVPAFVILSVLWPALATRVGAAGQGLLALAYLFAACTALHGELARARPAARHLTGFYLAVSAGGALGSLLVGVLAPRLFTQRVELPLGMALAWAAVGVAMRGAPARAKVGLGLGALATLGLLAAQAEARGRDTLFSGRDFFGVVRVVHNGEAEPEHRTYALAHGPTLHGVQMAAGPLRGVPTTYYGPQSGVGLVLAHAPRPLRVGVIGLGVGTVAAYGRPGDTFRFYEISPVVRRLALGEGGLFSYLADSQAKVELVAGDARLSLEREPEARFDVLVLDAYSGDAVPAHLLTREAMALYVSRLRGPDSVIAVHVTNRHLDLKGVVWRAARALQLQVALVRAPGNPGEEGAAPLTFDSVWMLLSRTRAALDAPAVAQATDRATAPYEARLWTDDYSAAFELTR